VQAKENEVVVEQSWQRWALGITVGILLGGGSSAIYGNSQMKAAEERLEEKIEALEVKSDHRYELLLDMSKGIVRLEEQLKHLTEKVDDQR
jgi:hypothetical protein